MTAAWQKWLLVFIPLFVVATLATDSFGSSRTMPVLLGLLACVLLYQRFVNRRSWRRILRGDEAPEG